MENFLRMEELSILKFLVQNTHLKLAIYLEH